MLITQFYVPRSMFCKFLGGDSFSESIVETWRNKKKYWRCNVVLKLEFVDNLKN